MTELIFKDVWRQLGKTHYTFIYVERERRRRVPKTRLAKKVGPAHSSGFAAVVWRAVNFLIGSGPLGRDQRDLRKATSRFERAQHNPCVEGGSAMIASWEPSTT